MAVPEVSWTATNFVAANGASRQLLRNRGALSLFMVGGRYGRSLSSSGLIGDIDTRFIATALAYRSGRFDALAGVTSAWHDAAIIRTIVFPGFGERSQSRYRSTSRRIDLEGQYSLIRSSALDVTPYAGYSHLMISAPAFAESGGASALSFSDENLAMDQLRLGLRVASDFKFAGLNFSPHMDANLERSFGALGPRRVARFGGAQTYFESGALGFNRTEASLNGGLDLFFGRATLKANYRVRRGDQWSDRTAQLIAALSF